MRPAAGGRDVALAADRHEDEVGQRLLFERARPGLNVAEAAADLHVEEVDLPAEVLEQPDVDARLRVAVVEASPEEDAAEAPRHGRGRGQGLRLAPAEEDREEREEGEHHLAALLERGAEGLRRGDAVLGLGEAVRVVEPRGQAVRHLHEDARAAEAAERPGDRVEPEDAVDEGGEVADEERRKRAEEEDEVRRDERLRAERHGPVGEEAHLERRAREQGAVRLAESRARKDRSVVPDQIRPEGVHRHVVEVELLDDGHHGDEGDERGEDRPTLARAGERIAAPDERHDRGEDGQRRELKRGASVIVEVRDERRGIQDRPRHQQQGESDKPQHGTDHPSLLHFAFASLSSS